MAEQENYVFKMPPPPAPQDWVSFQQHYWRQQQEQLPNQTNMFSFTPDKMQNVFLRTNPLGTLLNETPITGVAPDKGWRFQNFSNNPSNGTVGGNNFFLVNNQNTQVKVTNNSNAGFLPPIGTENFNSSSISCSQTQFHSQENVIGDLVEDNSIDCEENLVLAMAISLYGLPSSLTATADVGSSVQMLQGIAKNSTLREKEFGAALTSEMMKSVKKPVLAGEPIKVSSSSGLGGGREFSSSHCMKRPRLS